MFVAVLMMLTKPGHAQEPKSLLAPGAKVVKLAGGFRFCEGPATSPGGDVFFSDIPVNRIYKWSVDERSVTLVREQTGAANGLLFDPAGHLLACEGNARRLTSMSEDGQISVIVDGFKGKRFNRPNDLWMDPKGGIYFTDPGYGRRQSGLDLGYDGVYYVRPDGQDIILVSDDLDRPNGIIGQTEGDILYVTELQGGKTWRYRIQPDGTLADKTLLVAAGSDGMTMDFLKNVYLTNQVQKSVDIYAVDGQLVASIPVPEAPSNVTFAGPDRSTLFITASTSLYAIDMNVTGQ